jgi:hypothetical protein
MVDFVLLKGRNLICLNRDLTSGFYTRPSVHLSMPNRPELARTAFHWKIFFQY